MQPYLPDDCSTASCPYNCTSSVNGVCDTSRGVCSCNSNATVSYIGFDCFTPDPLHVFDPLEYYTRELSRLSVFFHGGEPRMLDEQQDEWLRMTRAPSTSGSATAGSVVSGRSRIGAALAVLLLALLV